MWHCDLGSGGFQDSGKGCVSQKLRLWDKRARVPAPTILWNDFHWLSLVCGRSLCERKSKDGVEWDIGSESTL